MADNNNLVVYCEFDEGRIADVSLELLTKGRQLATQLGVRLEALVVGDKLAGIESQIFPYGVDVVYKIEDARLYPYTSLPHASALINLFKEIKPQICLMGATCIGRDLGPRVSSCLHRLPTVHRSKSATTLTRKPRLTTKTCCIKFVPHSAVTSLQLSSTRNVVPRWLPFAKV